MIDTSLGMDRIQFRDVTVLCVGNQPKFTLDRILRLDDVVFASLPSFKLCRDLCIPILFTWSQCMLRRKLWLGNNVQWQVSARRSGLDIAIVEHIARYEALGALLDFFDFCLLALQSLQSCFT